MLRSWLPFVVCAVLSVAIVTWLWPDAGFVTMLLAAVAIRFVWAFKNDPEF